MHKFADMPLRAHVSDSECACATVQCLDIQLLLARRVAKVASTHVHEGQLDCLFLSVHAWQLSCLRANESDESGSRDSESAELAIIVYILRGLLEEDYRGFANTIFVAQKNVGLAPLIPVLHLYIAGLLQSPCMCYKKLDETAQSATTYFACCRTA